MNQEEKDRERMLDRTKAVIFESNNAAFFGPLMASLNFIWTDQIETSATDYESIFWNPADFDRLTPEERVSSLMHEIGHNYRLHGLRQGERDPKVWNIACDITINRSLRDSGYYVDGPWFVGPHFEIKAELEEEIYGYLINKPPPPPPTGPCAPSPNGMPDPNGNAQNPQQGSGASINGKSSCSCHQLGPITKDKVQKAIQNLVQATQQAKLAGQPGAIPGEVEQLFNTFLKPKIPWQQHIQQWLTDFLDSRMSYARPNRRYQAHGILMKSRYPDKGKLEHLVYAFDVSGSVTDEQVTRFNSEMKFIKDTYKPAKMTLLMFDTKIRRVIIIEEDDDFNELKVVGRGGTSLTDVRKYIMDNKATAAVIFSDLECAEMKSGPTIPIIWVCIDNLSARVPFGKLLHLESRDL